MWRGDYPSTFYTKKENDPLFYRPQIFRTLKIPKKAKKTYINSKIFQNSKNFLRFIQLKVPIS